MEKINQKIFSSKFENVKIKRGKVDRLDQSLGFSIFYLQISEFDYDYIEC